MVLINIMISVIERFYSSNMVLKFYFLSSKSFKVRDHVLDNYTFEVYGFKRFIPADVQKT